MAEKGNIAAAGGGGGAATGGGGGGRSPMGIMSSPEIERQQEIENRSNPLSSMRTAETLLRLVPMGLCVIALMIMLKDSQSNQYASLSYSDLGAFRFLVHANGICAGYSFLSAVVVVVPRPSTLSRAWTFFLLDQVLTYMILAAGAVATVVSFLAYKGDEDILWAEACDSYGAFCRKAIASIVITFVVMLSYAALSLLSSYRLFTNYDAPVGFNHRGIEITAFQP